MAKQQRQFRVKEILSIIIQEEADPVYVQLGGHGGGLMKPNSPEMEIASNKSWPKFKTTTPKVRMAKQQTQFRVMEILSILSKKRPI
jgi:hypothetical protein